MPPPTGVVIGHPEASVGCHVWVLWWAQYDLTDVVPTSIFHPHGADVIQLSAGQINALLSGNTIKGTWGRATYTQYFDASGFTVYIEDGRPPSRGKWRVKEDTNQYDSWWENTGWTPYTVMMTNTGYAWVNRGTLEPFTVLAGKQASF